MHAMTIGQVASHAGVGVETVRFYERTGLLDEPPRRASGYRQYAPDVVRRIQFIQRAKVLGFSLKEISELLSLRVDPETTCDTVKQRAEAKLADIEAKLRDLRRMQKALAHLVAAERPITFTAVAQEAGLARATLYRNPSLRALVDEHRARQLDARTLSGLSAEIAHLRTALEALAARVRAHEERLRRVEHRRNARSA